MRTVRTVRRSLRQIDTTEASATEVAERFPEVLGFFEDLRNSLVRLIHQLSGVAHRLHAALDRSQEDRSGPTRAVARPATRQYGSRP